MRDLTVGLVARRRSPKALILLASALPCLLACASRTTLEPAQNAVTRAGIISISGNWFKKKSKAVDASILITNQSSDFLSIPNSDLQCLIGETAVKADFRTGSLEQLKHSLEEQI